MRYRDRIRILGAGGASLVLAACGGGGGRDTALIGDPPGNVPGALLTQLAGNGTATFAGNNVAAAGAQLGNGQMTLDAFGNLFIADPVNHRVRMIARQSATIFGQAVTAGNIYTVAGAGTAGLSGNGGPATAAQLNSPEGVAIDFGGNLVIADTGNSMLRVVARDDSTPYGNIMVAGEIEAITSLAGPGFTGDDGPAGLAQLNGPRGLAVDPSGNILVADSANNVVRVIARLTANQYGVAMTAGEIHRIAGSGAGTAGFAGNGGAPTAALLNRPWGLAVDANFNVAIAERNNSVVRLIAGTGGNAFGLVLVANSLYTLAGDTTVATAGDGGPANAAKIAEPLAVAFSAAGHLFIAESQGNRVRVVARSNATVLGLDLTLGNIYTVAGNGEAGYGGDGSVAPASPIGASPSGLAIDTNGDLLISAGNRILSVGA